MIKTSTRTLDIEDLRLIYTEATKALIDLACA